MSELVGMEVQVGADLKQLVAELNKGEQKVEQFASEITSDLNKAGAGFDGMDAKAKKAGAGVSATAAKMGKDVKAGSDQAGNALMNLGRVAQDAPYGFIGIQNNLNPLLESFQRLKASTGSTSGAIKSLAGSLMGAGGLGLGLSLVSAAILFFSSSSEKAEQATTGFAGAVNAAKSSFVDVAANVGTLRQEINLAKDGFVNKDEVVKHYNETIGKTTGIVKNIDEAEQALNKNAGDFVQAMLFKAVAAEAMKKAAAEYFKVQKLLLTPLTAPEKKDGLIGAVMAPVEKAKHEDRKQRINEAFDLTVKYAKMSEEMNKRAAELFKKHKWSWFGGGGNKKNEKKPEAEVEKVLDHVRNQIESFSKSAPDISQILSPGSGKIEVNEYQMWLEQVRAAFIILQDNIAVTTSLVNTTLGPAFDALFQSIGEGGQNAFGNFAKALGETIKQLGFAVAKAIIFGAIISAITGKPFNLKAIISGALGIPGHATGVQNSRGGLAMVGERGPELVRLPNGADVIPNRALRMGSGGTQHMTVDGVLKASGNELLVVIDRATARRGRNG